MNLLTASATLCSMLKFINIPPNVINFNSYHQLIENLTLILILIHFLYKNYFLTYLCFFDFS